jgi:hypothetical protein
MQVVPTKETLIKWLQQRIAALRGARPLAVLKMYCLRVLCSVRLALHLLRSLTQRFLAVLQMCPEIQYYAINP